MTISRSGFSVLVALVLLPAVLFAQAPTDPARIQASHQLMEKMHIRELTTSTMKLMIDQVRTQQEGQGLPDELWNQFSSKFDSLSGIIVDSTTQIYARYYTTAELQELTRLYDNPVMLKMLQVTPQLSAETSQIGAQLGRETMMAIATDYYTRHPEAIPSSEPVDAPAPKGKAKKKK